ncbi:MAG: SGNH/GDSL hydrolase family protein [Legionellaceae bacterium]|nr:SGNH/GDSL hydrolase family protein [Legionellaceae bacterium]
MSYSLLRVVAVVTLIFCSFSLQAAPQVRSMVVFGDSLSDTGNTTHLLKSLRFEESPAYLVKPFKLFIIHRMEDFAYDYYIPQAVLDAGIEIVEAFFDQELGPMLANLVSDIRRVPILPGEPYWQNRFSNGRVWPEYLAPMLHLDREDRHQLDIHAFGGSWAVTYDYQLTSWNLIKHPIASIKNLVVGKLIPPSLGLTVQAWFLMNDVASPDDLFFIFTGANDYLHVLTFEDNYNSAVMSSYIDNVLDGIEYSVEKLVKIGAQQLVIMNLPDVSITPRIIHTSDRSILSEAVKLHNQRLQQRVQLWRERHPEVQYITIDIPQLMRGMIANPEAHGFRHTDTACIDVELSMFQWLHTPFAHNPSLSMAMIAAYQDPTWDRERRNYHRCADEDSYMFWDEIHPSTKTHRWFAFKVCEELAQLGYDARCELPS